MAASGRYQALGLMSGTSADGIDAAILETDGLDDVVTGPALSIPYPDDLQTKIRAAMTLAQNWQAGTPMPPLLRDAERAITHAHAAAIEELMRREGLTAGSVELIGFHGQTVLHRPQEQRTVQLGDGALLASLVDIDVVCDFRSADVAAGGEGAPLVPLYHLARASGLELPLAVLNIGGVSNVTFIGRDRSLLAFDTGPGNGPLDDWAHRHLGKRMDEGGALAKAGAVNAAALGVLLANPYFVKRPPKSLDRLDFDLSSIQALSPEDGAATLVTFTARAIGEARQHLPEAPLRWLVTGGGRHNPTLMESLRGVLGVPVEPVEAVGWRGDTLEAEAFGYLAVRSLKGLPLTLPTTTGVSAPHTGGVLHRKASALLI